MTWFIGVGVSVLLVLWLERQRRRREFYRGPNYVQQIQVWKPTAAEAIALPPIKEPKAERESDKVWRKLRRA